MNPKPLTIAVILLLILLLLAYMWPFKKISNQPKIVETKTNQKVVNNICFNGQAKVFKDSDGNIGGYVGRSVSNFISFFDAQGKEIGFFRADGGLGISDQSLGDLPQEIIDFRIKFPVQEIVECQKVAKIL